MIAYNISCIYCKARDFLCTDDGVIYEVGEILHESVCNKCGAEAVIIEVVDF